jgi:hypothetical protein
LKKCPLKPSGPGALSFEEVLEELELKKEKGWLLDWKTILIHYPLDQVFMWFV